jgi:hypothetical protein
MNKSVVEIPAETVEAMRAYLPPRNSNWRAAFAVA